MPFALGVSKSHFYIRIARYRDAFFILCHIIKKGEQIIFYERQNDSFINKNCEICGYNDLVLSSVNLSCNYGSKYDGGRIKLNICSNCADRIYKFIISIKGGY